jgi:hypothetical protein
MVSRRDFTFRMALMYVFGQFPLHAYDRRGLLAID